MAKNGKPASLAIDLFGAFVLLLGGTLPAPLYAIYKEQIGFNELVLTLVFGIYFVGAILALLFLGRTSQQVGRKAVLFGAVGVALASTLALIFARGLPLLFVGRLLSGVSVGWALPAATAYAAELHGGQDAQPRSAELSTVVQMAGLGSGPLLAGLLAEFAPWPTVLPYLVFIGLLAVFAALLLRPAESIREREALDFHARVGVKAEKWGDFLGLAATGFCTFAMVGLFTSVAGLVLKERLGISSHAIDGAVAFELFLFGAVAELLARRGNTDRLIVAALVVIPAGLVPLMLGVVNRSTFWFLTGTAVAGIGVGLGFGTTLAALSALSGKEDRTALLGSYFLVTYTAAVLPVVGIGAVTQLGQPVLADLGFAAVVGLLALAALAMRLRRGKD